MSRNLSNDCRLPPLPPHLEDFDGYFHVNVRSLAAASDEEEPTEIGCIVARTWVLTAHRGDVDIIESFLDPIKGETQLGRVEGPFFLAILLDWFLSEFFQAVEELERRLDDLDESLIAGDLQHGGEEAC